MNFNMNSEPHHGSEGPERSKIAKELIHEAQNHLHLAIMEVELAEMGVSERFDGVKLLSILNSLKRSMGALRDCLLWPVNLPIEDGMTNLVHTLAELRNKGDHSKFTVNLMQGSSAPWAELDTEHTRDALARLLDNCSQILKDETVPPIDPRENSSARQVFAQLTIFVVVDD